MDPVSAFGVACGILQVLQFATEVIKESSAIYNGVSPAKVENAQFNARHLKKSSSMLRDSLNPKASSPPANADDEELCNLATSCIETSERLLEKLDNMKMLGTGRFYKLRALGKGVASTWRRPEMEHTQQKLDDYRKVVETRILVRLRLASLFQYVTMTMS